MQYCPKHPTHYPTACAECMAELMADSAELRRVERMELEADRDRLRERLQFDPGGSDRIDELEVALDMTRAVRDRLREERDEARRVAVLWWLVWCRASTAGYSSLEIDEAKAAVERWSNQRPKT